MSPEWISTCAFVAGYVSGRALWLCEARKRRIREQRRTRTYIGEQGELLKVTPVTDAFADELEERLTRQGWTRVSADD